jgi:hypothetical protein
MLMRSLLALVFGIGMIGFPGIAPAQPADEVTERVVPDAEYQRLRRRTNLSVGGRASPLTLPHHPYVHGHPGSGYGPYGYGYGPWGVPRPVYYPPGSTPSESAPMEIGPVTPAGRVTLQVEPLDAEVLVDGHPLRRRDDAPYEVGLLEGVHQVEVRAPGHQEHRQEVVVRGGTATNLTVRLQPSQAP